LGNLRVIYELNNVYPKITTSLITNIRDTSGVKMADQTAPQLPLVYNDILQVPLHHLSKEFRNSQKSQEQGANVALKALKYL
jgi:hypothetical protein